MTSGENRGSRKRTLVLYWLYAIVAVFFFLYYKFPSDAVSDYLETAVESRIPPMALSVGSVDLDLPPGLVLKDVRLSRRDGPELVLFSAGNLRVRPEAGKLIRGVPAASVLCRAYGGSISGTVRLTERRLQGPVAAYIELSGIRLEENVALQELLGRRINGVLEGTMTFSGPPGNPWGGAAEIRLAARDGNVEIMQPFLGLDILEFSRMVLSGDLKDGKFHVTDGDIEGPDYRGGLTGTVFPAPGLTGSRLDLQGWVEPFPSFFTRKGASNVLNLVRQRLKRGKLNFSVKGTLGNPTISLI